MMALNLTNKRKEKELSQQALASLSGVSIKTIQAYEQGLKNINHAAAITLLNLSKVLECSIESLMENETIITEKAYAKININLKVVGKKDGYHALETIMAPIDLYDTLIFEKSNKLEVYGIDIENSSIHKAAQTFIQKYQTSPCKITVIKRIPIEAGLGGGSADSSAVLRGMNRLFNLNLSFRELESLAQSLGSDNTFCLYNQLALCTGRGEKVKKIKKSLNYHILLIKPKFGLSTRTVFENVIIKNAETQTKEVIDNLENLQKLDNLIENDLFEAALKVNDKLSVLTKQIKDLGFNVHMTGSGSCLFVMSEDFQKLKTLSSHFNTCFIKICLIKNCF